MDQYMEPKPNPMPTHVPQDKGLAAMERLDKSLDEFQALLEEKDKQEVPIKQQEALGFVGAVEEAMVKGFPYEVPKQYAALPQLKARRPLVLPSTLALRPRVWRNISNGLLWSNTTKLPTPACRGSRQLPSTSSTNLGGGGHYR